MVRYRSWRPSYQGKRPLPDPTNIQIWDLASGELKLSLTGHISTIRGLAISERHPYLFSAAEDKVGRRPSQADLVDGQVLGS